MLGGLTEDRVLRVQGLASSQPFERDDPLAPGNRRISIIVMNRDAEDRFFRPQVQPEPEAEAAPDATAAAPGAAEPAAPSLKPDLASQAQAPHAPAGPNAAAMPSSPAATGR